MSVGSYIHTKSDMLHHIMNPPVQSFTFESEHDKQDKEISR